jgi:hypothetical protein
MYDKPTRHSDLDYTNSATHFIKKKNSGTQEKHGMHTKRPRKRWYQVYFSYI